MNFDDHGLELGLGLTSTVEIPGKVGNTQKLKRSPPISTAKYEPALTLSLTGEACLKLYRKVDGVANKASDETAGSGSGDMHSEASPVSSFSNVTSTTVKREREGGVSEETEVQKVSSRASDEDEDGSNNRKKLRLTKEQSDLLEESFKQHSTLNPKQKQALAHQLNLRPRQVEVWFQNRRARTKLKQTELDCEFLKKCCETLTEENGMLQKELQELRALKRSQPFYMHLPAATLILCPSCESVNAGVGDGSASKVASSVASKSHHFYNLFTNPSAA
ncbi:hypothetical protein Nepgr_008323 [Nepenthes gracilis]|uniref:Homeobox domain-containing protein n=1 Tax=Nepenthes gracilis TaxID=150966 RepID=A0AAD3S8J0_NEPGR|nr:hypothetical protein Nepgr_008323 [Nepenthes gracilis]